MKRLLWQPRERNMGRHLQYAFLHRSKRGLGVVVMMQTLPFYDEASMNGYAGVEEAVYRSLK